MHQMTPRQRRHLFVFPFEVKAYYPVSRLRGHFVKIHADKTETDPPHALRVLDVRRILATVPPDWIAGLVEVRLTNSLKASAWAFFSRYDGSLTIYSRGCTAKQALIAILSELAASSLGINTRQRHRYSDAESHRLSHLIQPLVDRLLPAITPLKKPPGYCPVVPSHPVAIADENA